MERESERASCAEEREGEVRGVREGGEARGIVREGGEVREDRGVVGHVDRAERERERVSQREGRGERRLKRGRGERREELFDPLVGSAVESINPRLYGEHLLLTAYNNVLSEALSYQRGMLYDAWNCLSREGEDTPQETEAVLRVHVYNLHSNQPRQHDEALDSYTTEDFTYKGCASWTLRIHGSLISDTPQSMQDQGKLYFTSFFDSILIVTPDESILWDRRGGHTTEECDGLEIHRAGDTEKQIVVAFFPRYLSPHYSLSPSLSRLVGAKKGNLASVTKAIWDHVKKNNLLSTDKPGCIESDSLLIEITKRKSFKLEELPILLENHFLPPRPIIVTHQLKFKGNFLDSQTCVDIVMGVRASEVGGEGRGVPVELLDSEVIDDIDRDIEECTIKSEKKMNEISEALAERNQYLAYSASPCDMIKTLLNSKGEPTQVPLVDEDRLYEYEISDRRASYYTQPWIHGAIQNYLANQDKAIQTTIRNLSSSVGL